MTATKTPAFHKPPLFTRQQLIALLLPLIAEQALSVTIGLADTLMVSSVGEAAVSGVSLVDSFNTLMIQIMSALATGGAVVTSQYIGRQEPKDAKNAAAQILFILSSFSLLVAAVVVVGRHAILQGIFGSIDADVMHYAETYFLLSALSYPFIGLYNAGAALFRAQGNSKISMLSSLVMNVINIGGNAVLIFGFGMGVMGAALASLVSRAVACAVVLYLLQITLPEIILSPITYLSDMNTPLPMVVIGYQLSRADFRRALHGASFWVSAALRLVILPLLALGVCMLMRLDSGVTLAVVIAASTPPAALLGMFAAKFDRDVSLAPSLVAVQTLLSMITMPLVLGLAKFLV